MNHLGKSEQNFHGCHHARAHEMYYQIIRFFNIVFISQQLAQNHSVLAVCNMSWIFLIFMMFYYLKERKGAGEQFYTLYIHVSPQNPSSKSDLIRHGLSPKVPRARPEMWQHFWPSVLTRITSCWCPVKRAICISHRGRLGAHTGWRGTSTFLQKGCGLHHS